MAAEENELSALWTESAGSPASSFKSSKKWIPIGATKSTSSWLFEPSSRFRRLQVNLINLFFKELFFKFKMTLSELTSLEDRNLDLDNDGQPDKLVLPFYRTPPYLSAKPQVTNSSFEQKTIGILDSIPQTRRHRPCHRPCQWWPLGCSRTLWRCSTYWSVSRPRSRSIWGKCSNDVN